MVLGVEAERFRAPVSVTDAPWRLGARFELWLDRLHFLVWANTYDARGGREPVWWWGRKAARLGATEITGPDAGRRAAARRHRGLDRRRAPRPARPRTASGAVVVHGESVELGRLTPGPAARSRRPPTWRPTSSPRSPTAPGPARIVAPAGSGKTRVLTERLRHLLVDRGFEREAVLAVAYNKKAQLELEERTADFPPRVSTLNALGYRLLARVPRGRAAACSTSARSGASSTTLVPRGRPRANTDPLAPYLEGLTAIRLGLRDPEEVEAERDDVPGLARGVRPVPGRAAPSGARSTSTSRSTARSRCCSPTASSGAGPRPATATCSSTSSRT